MWQVGTGGTLFGALDGSYPVFPHLLEAAGYAIGHTGKNWEPGSLEPGNWDRHPMGDAVYRFELEERADGIMPMDYAANFESFVDGLEPGRPFFFWMGTYEPHRKFEKGAGLVSGKRLTDVDLPGIFPDLPEIRSDILDYYTEVEHADAHLEAALSVLEKRGLTERTLVVFTSDNGMAFPRAKTTLYDLGVRMPLIMRWPGVNTRGRRVSDFVSLIDLAPTFLEAAGVELPESITGRSLLPQLSAKGDGRIESSRNHVIAGIERHTWCRPDGATYPSRMLRTDDYLYIRNYAPDRWPAGDPDFESAHQGTYGDVDNSPTKALMIEMQYDPVVAPFFERAFGKRPEEELYDVTGDPWQLLNLASHPEYAGVRDSLSIRLDDLLRSTGDPRAAGSDPWSDYTYYFGEFAER
jgi:uncharacterized sulfatase